MHQISNLREKSSAKSVLSPNTIKGINSYEDLEGKVDELLFRSLRHTQRLDLNAFRTQLDKLPGQHKFLHLYIEKLVRTLLGLMRSN